MYLYLSLYIYFYGEGPVFNLPWFAMHGHKCFIYNRLINYSVKILTFQLEYYTAGGLKICLGFPEYEFKCMNTHVHLVSQEIKESETFIYMNDIDMLLMRNRNTLKKPCIKENYNNKLKALY